MVGKGERREGTRARVALLALFLALGPALVVGCATGEPRPNGPADPNARRLEDRAAQPDGRRDVFVRQGLAIGARTGVEVRTQLGTPVSTSGRAVANPRDPQATDSILTWQYPGVEVEIYRLSDGRRLVSRFTVSEARHLRFPDLTIGTQLARVETLIGAPVNEMGDLREYRCGFCAAEGAPGPVFVAIENGRVSRVEFSFPIDF